MVRVLPVLGCWCSRRMARTMGALNRIGFSVVMVLCWLGFWKGAGRENIYFSGGDKSFYVSNLLTLVFLRHENRKEFFDDGIFLFLCSEWKSYLPSVFS